MEEAKTLPLADVTVIDIATLLAGPFAAALLGDYGADVIKVEHPSGDPLRRFGHAYEDVPLLWKVANRNKKSVVLDLKEPEGREHFLRLAAQADVVIENFRPGTLERWGIGPDVLERINPRLVLTRVTGFGQDGPYASRPGFGTLAEAMSGLAAMSGDPDGPPMLPPFPLADAFAGVQAAYATMVALHARGLTGRGQIADVAITESMIGALGAQLPVFDKLGLKPDRLGNLSRSNAPRNVYRCADDRWVAVSAPAQSVAERVIRLVGRPELIEEAWFSSGAGRVAHRDVVDEAVSRWIAERDRDVVVAEFEAVEAAVAPIYEVDDVLEDPHFQARNVAIDIPDDELGSVRMQNVPFRLSATPGSVRWAGPRLGEHTEAVLDAAEPKAADVDQG
ncbi:CaiB/BaiF CoA transferase family protein [Streptomyces sp. NPDC090029]|uniref:CaiB/BaiF CoA transferase family protein n=1 Tax=Streptomyces sp. NPDC090029 TaxID=3365924 RepID=UPI0037FAAC09